MSDAEKEAEELDFLISFSPRMRDEYINWFDRAKPFLGTIAATLTTLRAENERLTKQVRECPTCDGSGAMDVVV